MAAYEETGEVKRISRPAHTVSIYGRQQIKMTGVEDIDSFNESEVIFLTSEGMMTVMGSDLHIAKLDLAEGLLVLEGVIQALDYADHEELRSKKGGLFSKVFK